MSLNPSPAVPVAEPGASRAALYDRFASVRTRSLALTADLAAEDQCVQSMPDASPTKWHLAHTSWFFEAVVLAPHAPGYAPFELRWNPLFNSYYESLGARYPRPQRGLLTRPLLASVHRYRAHVDAAVEVFINTADDHAWAGAQPLLELGLQHEQQHQELMLTDLLHAFSCNPLLPAYRSPEPPALRLAAATPPVNWIAGPAGPVRVGHAGDGFAFDNETPRHTVWLQPYRIADRLVTCGEFAEFIADGGYRTPSLWLSDGWAQAQAEDWQAPLYWIAPGDPARALGAVAGVRAGRRAAAGRGGAGHAPQLLRSGGLRGMGRRAAADGIRMGGGERPARPGAAHRPRLAVDPLVVRCVSRLPALAGARGRVQRQVHGGADGAARRQPGDAARARAGHLPELLSAGGALAIQRAAAGEGRSMTSDFGRDFLAGLAARPRSISPKYFYDAEGSRLFDRICELPEYYPTRTELGILERCVGEMAELAGAGAEIVEFGAGSLRKVRLLLQAFEAPARYVPIDISGEHLRDAAAILRREFPRLAVQPEVADYTQPLALPAWPGGGRRIGFFPGSTIGNFTPEEALHFLEGAARMLRGGALILGADLVKDPQVLHAAYNDAEGVTAAFNLNLLERANRELGANFQAARFAHYAFYNAPLQRIEMHLVSRERQSVTLCGERFFLEEGETLHTENSCKFTIAGLRELATRAGFRPGPVWTDPERLFSVHWLHAP